MAWQPRNVSAIDETTEEACGVKAGRARKTVQPAAVATKRQVCSAEMHGFAKLEDFKHCPVCGHSLASNLHLCLGQPAGLEDCYDSLDRVNSEWVV